MEITKIEELKGRIVKAIRPVTDSWNEDVIRVDFRMEDGDIVSMCHAQDCCEYVYLADIVGDLDDLVGQPIVVAEGRSEVGDRGESSTWTFYQFRTAKGDVTFRWLGESNGYHGEEVMIQGSDFSYCPYPEDV